MIFCQGVQALLSDGIEKSHFFFGGKRPQFLDMFSFFFVPQTEKIPLSASCFTPRESNLLFELGPAQEASILFGDVVETMGIVVCMPTLPPQTYALVESLMIPDVIQVQKKVMQCSHFKSILDIGGWGSFMFPKSQLDLRPKNSGLQLS